MVRRLIIVGIVGIAIGFQGCILPDPIEEAVAEVSVVEKAAVAVVRPLKAIMDSLGWGDESIAIQVDKSDRQMRVLVKDSILKTYQICLGLNPAGDKEFQGDKKTPEGSFSFRDKYPHKDWHKFIWVDYPNKESWRRFNERKSNGDIPADSRIGGEIGIHGVPEGMDDWIVSGSDWTFGCIAMRNVDIDEIYPFILAKRTMMEIKP